MSILQVVHAFAQQKFDAWFSTLSEVITFWLEVARGLFGQLYYIVFNAKRCNSVQEP